ncbi:MAG: hypothetical protein HFP76_07460 [Methylococcales symbiont of Iophon sp. n. MRB-2018]|nr:MAG: hypothetical protein HFP76_07460 [Methylococcales symbiont of Iophon sp. n. MRB-2018]
MKRILYPIQQITLNEKGLVALFGVDFVSMFLSAKRPRNRYYFTKYWLIFLCILFVLLL